MRSVAGMPSKSNAHRFQLTNDDIRVFVMHHGDEASVVAQLLRTAASALKPDAMLNAAGRLVASALNGETALEAFVQSMCGAKKQRRKSIETYYQENAAVFEADRIFSSAFAAKVLKISPQDAATVVNGKVFVFPRHEGVFQSNDYQLLVHQEVQTGILRAISLPLRQFLPFAKGSSNAKGNIAMQISSILSRPRQVSPRVKTSERFTPAVLQELIEGTHTIKSLASVDGSTVAHSIVAVVDPLSREAQMLSPILQALVHATKVDLHVVFNPMEKLSELPLKRFFKFLARPQLTFQADGTLAMNAKITFTNLPAAPLLTMILHTPPAWMAQPIQSAYDLDNIHLETAKSSVRAIFELKYILIEGACVHYTTQQPAAGIQLQLGDAWNPAVYDTIVMANLGYFQLKALPGSWLLRLRPGRSTSVYEIDRVVSFDANAALQQSSLVVRSFTGKFVQIFVKPLPGKEKVRLLDLSDDSDEKENPAAAAPPAPPSLWNRFSGMFSSTPAAVAPEAATPDSIKRQGETIHVFSLASGHLYERFMKIMMLSVLKNTQHPVKFWFLENCMSPRFKEFLPSFAQEYGVEFELVQYNWPSWLNKQTEKHRVIWAYKILFLDVLFPLNVKKIIFVDADQVVRADLQELVDLDLEGAPYGYTPFCDSREDMDGFRFWKSGYWHGHLAGRKYHISALYVIDLVRFRQMAAGDQLRQQYHSLSQDPNSLSNLDQDLPNFMIHQVMRLTPLAKQPHAPEGPDEIPSPGVAVVRDVVR